MHSLQSAPIFAVDQVPRFLLLVKVPSGGPQLNSSRLAYKPREIDIHVTAIDREVVKLAAAFLIDSLAK